MKHIGLSLVLWLALIGSLSAQVSVEVLLDHDQFLPNETMTARVRVVNNSGQTLRFGDEDWLSYSIEASDGFIILKNGNAPAAHNFEIKAAEMGTTHADLSPYFNVSKPGRYSVIATVHIKDWSRDVSSPPKHFNIIRGVTIWEQEFGVPQSAEDHSPPEVRKYLLQQATLERHSELYLRLTDNAETRTLRIFPIGPMISFSDPQMHVDRNSNLHLVYQQAAHIYNYTVVNPLGEITTRQTYYYTTSAPHLRVDENGSVQIVGGERHVADDDLPAKHRSLPTNDIPLPVPRSS